MDDMAGRLIAGVLAIVISFFTPFLVISQKAENTAQDIIQNEIVRFVDNARATGVITAEAYENLCYKIDSVQELCKVTITHSSADKVYNEDTDAYEVYYFDYVTQEILDELYKDGSTGRYHMKQGDFISITVHNTAPTFATKIYRLILIGYAPSDITIYSTYSGYVGNDPQ